MIQHVAKCADKPEREYLLETIPTKSIPWADPYLEVFVGGFWRAAESVTPDERPRISFTTVRREHRYETYYRVRVGVLKEASLCKSAQVAVYLGRGAWRLGRELSPEQYKNLPQRITTRTEVSGTFPAQTSTGFDNVSELVQHKQLPRKPRQEAIKHTKRRSYVVGWGWADDMEPSQVEALFREGLDNV